MAIDSDETDRFFSAYQNNAKKSDQAVEAIKRIHDAPKLRVRYPDLVNTIWEIWKIPARDVSSDHIDQALYLLSRKHKAGVELDPVSCPRSGAQSSSLGIRFCGPNDMELLIEPYDDGYVWRLRNGQLKAVERIRFEILGVQTFDAEKAAFREATGDFRGYWPSINRLLSGALTKSIIFVAFEDDGLRLGQTGRMNRLSWPNSDHNQDKRWLINMRVVGLSREWPIKVDLRWTVGTKTLDLFQPGVRAEDRAVPSPRPKVTRGTRSSFRTRDPLAASENATSARNQAKCRKTRSAWLDKQIALQQWSSDSDIASHRGPTYNTIKRYRSGRPSTRDTYVRGLFAKVFGLDISVVPK